MRRFWVSFLATVTSTVFFRLFTHIAEMKKKSSNSIHFHLVELFVVKLRVYSISAANKLNLYIFITIFLLNILIFFTHSLSLGRSFIHSFLFHGIDVCVIFSFILFHFNISFFVTFFSISSVCFPWVCLNMWKFLFSIWDEILHSLSTFQWKKVPRKIINSLPASSMSLAWDKKNAARVKFFF